MPNFASNGVKTPSFAFDKAFCSVLFEKSLAGFKEKIQATDAFVVISFPVLPVYDKRRVFVSICFPRVPCQELKT